MSKNESWELLLGKAKEIGKAVGDAACDVVDTSKQKLEEVRLRHDLEDAYENLGRLYYKLLKGETNEPGKTEQLMAEIDCLSDQLRQNKERNKKKDTDNEPPKCCPHCGGLNRADASYCSFCGKEIRSARSDTGMPEDTAE